MNARAIIDIAEEGGLEASQKLWSLGGVLAEYASVLANLDKGWSHPGPGIQLRTEISKELDERYGRPMGGIFNTCMQERFISQIVHYLTTGYRAPAVQEFQSDDVQRWLARRFFKFRFDERIK